MSCLSGCNYQLNGTISGPEGGFNYCTERLLKQPDQLAIENSIVFLSREIVCYYVTELSKGLRSDIRKLQTITALNPNPNGL